MKIEEKSIIEFANIWSLSDEEIKKLDGLDLLTPHSKETFLKWCSKIKVPQKISEYDPLITDHQSETEYRKARDEEHKFRNKTLSMFRSSKIEYRNNKTVIPVNVSDKVANRAYRIIDTLIKSVKDLKGVVTVHSSQEDNGSINLFECNISFKITERRIKRRSLAQDQFMGNRTMSLRPAYESVFGGNLVLEFSENVYYWQKDRVPKYLFKFEDKPNEPLENQLGEIFVALIKVICDIQIANTIIEGEAKLKEKEEQRLKEIEEERRRELQEIEDRKKRRQHLVDNIEQQMEGWFRSQKLRQYAQELEDYALTVQDEKTKKILSAYIILVLEKVAKRDPVMDIVNEIKEIGVENLANC